MVTRSIETAAPLEEINTTPLIDVLLVLLFMLVIAIPAATHSLNVELPTCGTDCEAPNPDPVMNRVTLDSSDRLMWNGAEVTEAELSAALAASLRLRVEPELQFAPDGAASYDKAARTMRLIVASGVTKFGFVGNEQFREFPSGAS